MKGSFLAGAILGAAVGVAVGLMYAPRAGEETRAQLAAAAQKAKEALAEQRRSGLWIVLLPVSVSVSTSRGS